MSYAIVFIDQNPQDMEVGHDITENDILSQTTEGLTSIGKLAHIRMTARIKKNFQVIL